MNFTKLGTLAGTLLVFFTVTPVLAGEAGTIQKTGISQGQTCGGSCTTQPYHQQSQTVRPPSCAGSHKVCQELREQWKERHDIKDCCDECKEDPYTDYNHYTQPAGDPTQPANVYTQPVGKNLVY